MKILAPSTGSERKFINSKMDSCGGKTFKYTRICYDLESSFYQDVKSRQERGQRIYIIAEIGSNHNGDIELAKTIIDSAAKCGADAAKFQSWTPSSADRKRRIRCQPILR